MSKIPNQMTRLSDDPWLINFFKNFEKMPVANRAETNWPVTLDFQVFSEFFIKDIRDIQTKLKKADNDYLYYVCAHLFNILDWIKLMVFDAGLTTLATAFEDLFEKEFGNKNILQDTYDLCFKKWLSQVSGQQKIGENFYNIFNNNLYYRNRFEEWFEVDKKTAFDFKPNRKLIKDVNIIKQLNKEYKQTAYDSILKQWNEKQYQGTLPNNFLQFDSKETTPEAYSEFTMTHIKTLLKNPVSIAELERWNGGKIQDLEDIIKICVPIQNIVTDRRQDNSLTLYLLRDCLMFYEAHKTLDLLNSQNTSFDQILVGRKLLSHKSREWGYYIATLEALYNAHIHYPTNFKKFYDDYARLLDMFVSLNPGFASVVANLAEYIKQHIQTSKKKIVIFDIGFQGSIALLTKYIIDRHVNTSGTNSKTKTDIKIGVVALWSKKLFKEKYLDDYFPFLNRLQLLARSNDLYHYKTESLNKGELKILLGDEENQRKANIELVVLVIVILLAQTK